MPQAPAPAPGPGAAVFCAARMTALGRVAIAVANGAVTNLWLPGDALAACPPRNCGLDADLRAAPATAAARHLLDRAFAQLAEYLSGARRVFALPLAPAGTAFQRAVWDAMLAIPYGQTRSYGEVAARLGRPGAARAVGGACGANPIPVFIPCHRVTAADSLGGFSSGLPLKLQLLRLENAVLPPC